MPHAFLAEPIIPFTECENYTVPPLNSRIADSLTDRVTSSTLPRRDIVRNAQTFFRFPSAGSVARLVSPLQFSVQNQGPRSPMKSQALICNEQQEFSLEEFEIPPLSPAQLLVRCTYSGVSVGTEFAVFRRKLDYGPFPVCTGYQAVGVVEDVGSDVTRFAVGDKVYYRRNFIPMQVNGWPVTIVSGVHASYTVLPQDAEIERLPAKALTTQPARSL